MLPTHARRIKRGDDIRAAPPFAAFAGWEVSGAIIDYGRVPCSGAFSTAQCHYDALLAV
jgi:hypothetical protein